MDERILVETLARVEAGPLPRDAVGPGEDDAAVVPMGDHDLVVTTDLIAEGVHFRPASDPERIGRFLASVNLSDLAAMGAEPLGMLVAYGVPDEAHAHSLEAVHTGLAAELAAHGCPLLGGDTKDAGSFQATGTAFGTVPRGTAVRRSGAQVGDLLVLTGPVGGVGAALHAHGRAALGSDAWDAEVLGVAPRIAAGSVLRTMGAHAMTDLSDGLARGASLIAEASDVGLRIEAGRLAVADRVAEEFPGKGPEDPAWRQAVVGTGGEYELLAAVPADAWPGIERALRADGGVEPARIGEVVADHGAVLHTGGAQWDLAELGWRHLRGTRTIPDPDRTG